MQFHETVAGKQFFTNQLPRLIAALTDIAAALKEPTPVFRLEQEIPSDYLTDLYYGCIDPSGAEESDLAHTYTANMIAHQDQMRKILTPEAWDLVEEYRSLLDNRGALEREQAFAAGFQHATKLFAAGLAAPSTAEKTN